MEEQTDMGNKSSKTKSSRREAAFYKYTDLKSLHEDVDHCKRVTKTSSYRPSTVSGRGHTSPRERVDDDAVTESTRESQAAPERESNFETSTYHSRVGCFPENNTRVPIPSTSQPTLTDGELDAEDLTKVQPVVSVWLANQPNPDEPDGYIVTVPEDYDHHISDIIHQEALMEKGLVMEQNRTSFNNTNGRAREDPGSDESSFETITDEYFFENGREDPDASELRNISGIAIDVQEEEDEQREAEVDFFDPRDKRVQISVDEDDTSTLRLSPRYSADRDVGQHFTTDLESDILAPPVRFLGQIGRSLSCSDVCEFIRVSPTETIFPTRDKQEACSDMPRRASSNPESKPGVVFYMKELSTRLQKMETLKHLGVEAAFNRGFKEGQALAEDVIHRQVARLHSAHTDREEMMEYIKLREEEWHALSLRYNAEIRQLRKLLNDSSNRHKQNHRDGHAHGRHHNKHIVPQRVSFYSPKDVEQAMVIAIERQTKINELKLAVMAQQQWIMTLEEQLKEQQEVAILASSRDTRTRSSKTQNKQSSIAEALYCHRIVHSPGGSTSDPEIAAATFFCRAAARERTDSKNVFPSVTRRFSALDLNYVKESLKTASVT